jgi:hypothetical protein
MSAGEYRRRPGPQHHDPSKALREFQEFLEDKGKSKDYAGLHRVMTECGDVVWTSEANVGPLTLSAKVAAITEEKKEIQNAVASITDDKCNLQTQLEELKWQPPPHGGSLKLQQKSG